MKASSIYFSNFTRLILHDLDCLFGDGGFVLCDFQTSSNCSYKSVIACLVLLGLFCVRGKNQLKFALGVVLSIIS